LNEAVTQRSSNCIRPCLIIILISCTILFISLDNSLEGMGFLMKFMRIFSPWFRSHVLEGTFCFFSIFLLVTFSAFPGTLLNNLSGYIYVSTFGLYKGMGIAVVVSFMSMAISSNIAFIFARYCCKNSFLFYMEKKSKYTHAVMLAMKHHQLQFGFLLRICPLVTFSSLNYLFSGLNISFIVFNILHLGFVPTMLVNILMGAFFGKIIFDSTEAADIENVAKQNQAVAAIITSIFLILVFIVLLTRKTKKMLREIELLVQSEKEPKDQHEERKEENKSDELHTAPTDGKISASENC